METHVRELVLGYIFGSLTSAITILSSEKYYFARIKNLTAHEFLLEIQKIGTDHKSWEVVVSEIIEIPQLLDSTVFFLKQVIDELAEEFLGLKEFENEIKQTSITPEKLKNYIDRYYYKIQSIHQTILKIENYWIKKYEELG